MPIEVIVLTEDALVEYARIPISFTIRSRLRFDGTGLRSGHKALVDEVVVPYHKDYDAIPGEGPLHWARQFDLDSWGLFGAFDGSRLIGGAAVTGRLNGIDFLHGRNDVATLWDIRVHPDYRSRGVGTRLFGAAADWAKGQGCRSMLIETQDVNAPACQFYMERGCTLAEVNPSAYSPDISEVQLIWELAL